jgi:hypothetical protein
VVESLLPPIPCLPTSLGSAGLDPLIPVAIKPMKCYNRNTKDSRFTKIEDSRLAETVSVFVAPPVLSSVVVVLEPFGKITDTAPTIAQVPESSADVGFLWRGFLTFLKLSFSVVRGCPAPPTLDVINPSCSVTVLRNGG